MQLIWKREIVSCEGGKETTFNPTAYKTEYFSRALWSPCGISIHGGYVTSNISDMMGITIRCLLLVLTNYGRVVLLSAKDDPNLGPFEPVGCFPFKNTIKIVFGSCLHGLTLLRLRLVR